MKRSTESNHDAGFDSFMDIVSNAVGIIIVLVMVVGARVQQSFIHARATSSTTPATAPPADNAAQKAESRALAAQVQQRLSAVAQATENYTETNAHLAAAREVREQLGALATTIERELATVRDRLSVKERESFDLARQLTTAKSQRDELQLRQVSLIAQSTPEVMEVVSYPTPLARVVDSREEHYRLLGGRLVRVPLEELKDLVIAEHRQLRWQLKDLPEVVGTVGPVDGFKLDYQLVRTTNGAEMAAAKVVPPGDNIGEPLAAALADGSTFRRQLAQLDPGRTTITVWVYTDSFAAYRQLKQHLYLQGFTTAAWPRHPDMPIGMSSHGLKSTAE